MLCIASTVLSIILNCFGIFQICKLLLTITGILLEERLQKKICKAEGMESGLDVMKSSLGPYVTTEM